MAAVSQGPGPDDELPPKCCFDKQWTAYITDYGGWFNQKTHELAPIDGGAIVSFDFYTHKQSAVWFMRNTTADPNDNSTSLIRFSEVRDWRRRTHYMKFGENNCTMIPLMQRQIPPCIPGNATLISDSVMGYGRTKLEVFFWEFDVSDQSDLFQSGRMKMGVPRDCIPAIELIDGISLRNNTFLEMNLFFTGYHPGISDTHAFDLENDPCFLDQGN